MNKFFVNTIYEYLSPAITKAYKDGIASIVKGKQVFADTPLVSVDWTKADRLAMKRFQMEAFLVAGVGAYELQEKLKALGIKIMDGTIPDFDSWELEARSVLLEYGIGLKEQPPEGWLRTNLETAITSSIHAARWIRFNEPAVSDLYPALEYRTQGDGRVRDAHRQLDRRVWNKHDKIWLTIYPPNGWRCRCFVNPIHADELSGYPVEATSEAERKQITETNVDEDFRFNAGDDKSIWKRWLRAKLNDIPSEEKAKLKKLAQT